MPEHTRSLALLAASTLATALLVLFVEPTGAADAVGESLDLESIALHSEDGSLRVEPVVLVQPMFLLHVDASGAPETEGSGFALRRAEAGLKGHVGGATYLKLVGALEHGEAVVVDAYVHIDPLDGSLTLRTGFFKPPYCRQFLVTDAKRQLADEAVALGIMAPHEQLGVQLGGALFDVVDYRVGVWVAADAAFAGATGAALDPLVGGSFVVHPLGPVGADEEPDLVRTASPKFSIGGSLLYDRRGDRVVPLAGIGDVGYSDNRLRIGGELAGKWRGASLASEVFLSRVWVAEDTPLEVADRLPPVRGFGGYLQAGYFAVAELLEVALRFDFVDRDLEVAGWDIHPAAGVQLYPAGHLFKMMIMYRLNFPIDDPYPVASSYHTPTTHDAFLVLQGAF
ncbi:MAG: hypothetical protein JRF63_06545 [Deltaproteobacteria bacterium]|nr:hypothetical protein [Deltaproteobacteria bacterium]